MPWPSTSMRSVIENRASGVTGSDSESMSRSKRRGSSPMEMHGESGGVDWSKWFGGGDSQANMSSLGASVDGPRESDTGDIRKGSEGVNLSERGMRMAGNV